MEKIALCLDWEKFKIKPERAKIIEIQNRIAKTPTRMSLNEIVEAVLSGRSFCPTIFTCERRKQEFFKAMQLFVLDFDDGLPYEVIAGKFLDFNLPIFFSYHTLRSKPEYPKYRIILKHTVPITDRAIATAMLLMLKKMFPEADPLCFECSRMFLGGKKLIELHETAVFRIDHLTQSFYRYIHSRDPNNWTRVVRNIARTCDIRLDQGKYFDIRTNECDVDPFQIEEKSFKNSNYMMIPTKATSQ